MKVERAFFYRLLSRCSITVAAFVLAGRCSVTVLLPLSKWLFFGLLLRWFPSSRKWWPKWVSRVIFEWSSFKVSPFRFAEFTLTEALIGFITCLTGAGGGGVDDNVEQLAFSDANKGVQTPAARLYLVNTISDIDIDIVYWSLFSLYLNAGTVAEHQSSDNMDPAAGCLCDAPSTKPEWSIASTSPSKERKDLGPDLLQILDPNPVRHNTLYVLSRFDFN